jgi:NADPH2:quinone reductase
MTETMIAFVAGTGGELAPTQLPTPTPGDAEVLVKTAAASFNNADSVQDGPGQIAGYEFAGVIAAVGESVDPKLLGQRVMGITVGAFAEYVVAHHRHVVPVPGDLSDEEAASLPTALTTEYGALRRAGFHPGDTVLITAATSNLGLIGTQLAKALGASTVIGTTRSASHQQVLRDVGADVTIATDEADLVRAGLAGTHGEGADIVLDHVGGSTLAEVLSTTRSGGSVVSVGRLSGDMATIDVAVMAARGLSLHAVSYGFADPEVLGRLLDGLADEVLPAVAERRVKAVVSRVLPFDHAPEALEELRSGEHVGKLVLRI